jgi:membrane protease YdiL (CAAX protease family)
MIAQPTRHLDVGQRDNLIAWVRKHPVLAFVILAFGISWLVWSINAVFPADQAIVGLWVFRLGTFGPAIAAMLVAWLLNPTLTHVRPKVWWAAFLGGALFGWLYHSWKGDIAYGASYPVMAYVVAAITMLVWGWMVAAIVGRTQGVRSLMRRQIKFPGWGWITFVILAPILIQFAGIGLTNLSGDDVRVWQIVGTWDVILPLLVSVIIGVWITGGGNEEPGWRGFMHAHLQKYYSPLVAGGIVGVVMGLWHFPLHFLGYYADIGLYDGMQGLVFRIVSNIALGIAFAWLYNRSRGSLLLVMLFHVAINASSIFIVSTSLTQVLMFLAVLAIIPIGKMWKKLPPDEVQALLT